MNKPILSILAAKRLAFAFCSKQEKRDVENINAELKALSYT